MPFRGDKLLKFFRRSRRGAHDVANAAAALTIGTPILFASVAHGTGHDIAGQGIASPAAMIEAALRLSKAKVAAGALV